MVLDRRNIFLFPFRRLTYRTLSSIYLPCVRPKVKMFPETSSLLPVTPWIIVSVPLGKAAQIYTYFTFYSPLPEVVFFLIIVFRVPIFYSEFFEVHKF